MCRIPFLLVVRRLSSGPFAHASVGRRAFRLRRGGTEEGRATSTKGKNLARCPKVQKIEACGGRGTIIKEHEIPREMSHRCTVLLPSLLPRPRAVLFCPEPRLLPFACLEEPPKLRPAAKVTRSEFESTVRSARDSTGSLLSSCTALILWKVSRSSDEAAEYRVDQKK